MLAPSAPAVSSTGWVAEKFQSPGKIFAQNQFWKAGSASRAGLAG
jgi:hypothetical protein